MGMKGEGRDAPQPLRQESQMVFDVGQELAIGRKDLEAQAQGRQQMLGGGVGGGGGYS